MDSKIHEPPLTWHPITGGKPSPVTFVDDLTASFGRDPTGQRFNKITEQILGGNYYPADAVQFSPTRVPLQVGTRILQRAPIFPGFNRPTIDSVVEIFIAELSCTSLHIGYVTTSRHHARGIWQAKITLLPSSELQIRVWSTAIPHSILYWVGLPYARFLQLRARRRAIEEFKKL